LSTEENMSTTTREERPTCSCGRPAVHDPWEGEARYCAEHQRVIVASEIYGDWLDAHEAIREKFGEVLTSAYGSALQDVLDTAMEKIRRQCAHWRGELEIAELMAEHGPDGGFGEARSLSPEEAERVGRFLTRSDRLEEAIDALSEAPGINESKRWAMLAALYEVKDQADEEFKRARASILPA
jgi:hypothetical protein